MGSESFLQSVEANFDQAASLLGISTDLAKKIKIANSTYVVRFGVRLRGGVQTFTGYRSVHSEHFEPVKGGIRYAPHARSGRSGSAGCTDDLQMRTDGNSFRWRKGRAGH